MSNGNAGSGFALRIGAGLALAAAVIGGTWILVSGPESPPERGAVAEALPAAHVETAPTERFEVMTPQVELPGKEDSAESLDLETARDQNPFAAVLTLNATHSDGRPAALAKIDLEILAREPISPLLVASSEEPIELRLQRLEDHWLRAHVEDVRGGDPAVLDMEGTARLLVHTPGLYLIAVAAGGHARQTTRVELLAGSDQTVTIALRPSARLQIHTVGAGETEPRTTVVLVDKATGLERTEVSNGSGEVVFDHLQPNQLVRLMGYKIIEEGTWQSRWTEIIVPGAGNLGQATVDLGKREPPLGRFTEIEGTVIDAETNLPITDGWVTGLTGGDINREGRFRIQPIPDAYTHPLTGTFEVTADDYRSARVRVTLDPPDRPTIRMQPMLRGNTELRLRAVGPAGESVRGARINGDIEIRGEYGALDYASFSLPSTDPSGRTESLRIGLVGGESARVEVRASTRGGTASAVFVLQQGQRKDAELRVAPEASVSGTVVLSDGTPISGFAVFATPSEDPLSAFYSRSKTTSSGSFSLDAVPVGPLTIVVRGPLFGAVHPIDIPSGGRTNVRITLSPVREVLITAIDNNTGNPIYKTHLDPGAQGWPAKHGRLTGPADTTLPVFVIAEGYRTKRVNIPPEVLKFEVALSPADR